MFGFGKTKQRIKGARIAVLVADGVEQAQLDAALKPLQKAGAETFTIAPRGERVQAFRALRRSVKVPVDATLDEVHPASFAAVLIPGGTLASDILRQDLRALEFVRSFDRNHKPIAAIGHGVAVLASAGVVAGRTITGWPAIKDDLAFAGGQWQDEPYVKDAHLLTGRISRDASKWARQLIKHITATVDPQKDLIKA
jgi:protease I